MNRCVHADIASGKYNLTANGTTASGQDVETSITIAVERPDAPASIRANLPSLVFEGPGGDIPMVILGSFSDGSVPDVTASSYVAYTSSNAAVATVSPSVA